MHIRADINIVLLGGDKGVDTEGGSCVEILIVNLSHSFLHIGSHEEKKVATFDQNCRKFDVFFISCETTKMTANAFVSV